jgi:hypothetical protein
MRYIKHSKFRNTGLIFEVLVRQIAADTIAKKDSPAVNILKKYYNEKTALGKEYKLYEFITKQAKLTPSRAELVLNTLLEASKKLSKDQLRKQKYELIKEIKQHYNIEELFSIKVKEYKPYAALHCLLEIHNTADLIDPQSIVDNKSTILEHLTGKQQTEQTVKDNLIEEYSKYDKDLKLLTYRILLEKFNSKYQKLLPEQKSILREFIVAVDSSKKLQSIVNQELEKIKESILKYKPKVVDQVTKIKLDEIVKTIKPLKSTDKIGDSHLVNLMQYYDLVAELKAL